MIGDKRQANIALRPNITERKDAWTLVPGDIVEHWRPDHLTRHSTEAAVLQREEKMYYRRCALCGRHVGQIKLEGPARICFDSRCPEARNA